MFKIQISQKHSVASEVLNSRLSQRVAVCFMLVSVGYLQPEKFRHYVALKLGYMASHPGRKYCSHSVFVAKTNRLMLLTLILRILGNPPHPVGKSQSF
jgi:uncharacterized membrane protein